jgi:hypothetical protein
MVPASCFLDGIRGCLTKDGRKDVMSATKSGCLETAKGMRQDVKILASATAAACAAGPKFCPRKPALVLARSV